MKTLNERKDKTTQQTLSTADTPNSPSGAVVGTAGLAGTHSRGEASQAVSAVLPASLSASLPAPVRKAVSAVVMLVMALFAGFALTAGGDWGGDDGSSGGGGDPAGSWHTIYPSSSQSAWAQYDDLIWDAWGNSGEGYLKGSGYNSSRKMSDADIEVCKSAEFIWYYSNATNGNNHIIANGNTNNAALPTRSGADNNRGRAASEEEWDAWTEFGTQIYPQWYQGRMSIICASDAWLITEEEVEVVEKETRTQDMAPIEITGTTDIHARADAGIDFSGDFGQHTLRPENQVELTPYGELYNEVRSGEWDNVSHDRLMSALREAERQSDPYDSSNDLSIDLTLSENNRKAMAEGGVMNISELYRTAQIELPRTQQQERERTLTYICPTDYSDVEDDCELENRGSWSSWANNGLPDEHAANSLMMSSPQVSGGYQMVSAVCNAEGFETAAAAVDGVQVQVRNEDTGGAALSHSLITPKQEIHSGSPNWAYGNTNGAAGAGGTDSMNFFTKSCDFTCVPSDEDGAVEVVNNKNSNSYFIGQDAPDHSAQVEYEEGISADIALSRDNTSTNVRYSVPVIDHIGIGAGNFEPVQTIVERWERGTPNPIPDDDGRFSMRALHDGLDDGSELLFNGNDEIYLRGDGNFTAGHNTTVSVLDEVVQDFSVSANWASESGRPEVVNVGYVYEAELDSSAFYGVSSGQFGTVAEHSKVMTTTDVFGSCSSSTNGSSSTEANTEHLTGAGTPYEGQQEQLKDFSNEDNLLIHFFRMVSER